MTGFLCECERLVICEGMIDIPAEDLLEIRYKGCFIVLPGHQGANEEVVETHDGYLVVKDKETP